MATVDALSVRVNVRDSDDRPTATDYLIDEGDVTVDAGLLTAIDGYVADCFGDTDGSKAYRGAPDSVQLVIDVTPDSVPSAPSGDVGLGWQFKFPSGTRRTLGTRSDYGTLTTAESRGEFADRTQAAIGTLLDRMFNDPADATTPGLGVRDADGTNPLVADVGIRATRSKRQRPRV